MTISLHFQFSSRHSSFHSYPGQAFFTEGHFLQIRFCLEPIIGAWLLTINLKSLTTRPRVSQSWSACPASFQPVMPPHALFFRHTGLFRSLNMLWSLLPQGLCPKGSLCLECSSFSPLPDFSFSNVICQLPRKAFPDTLINMVSLHLLHIFASWQWIQFDFISF